MGGGLIAKFLPTCDNTDKRVYTSMSCDGSHLVIPVWNQKYHFIATIKSNLREDNYSSSLLISTNVKLDKWDS
jgi:hypothetical protein